MRAAGNEQLLLTVYDKTLFMGEIILHILAVHPSGQVEVTPGTESIAGKSRKNRNISCYLQIACQEHDLRKLSDRRIYADIALSVIIFAQRRALHIDDGLLVHLTKGRYAAGMIVMSMAEHDKISRRQIHTQLCRIRYRLVTCPCIRQNLISRRLYVQTQPVLVCTCRVAAGIFHQNSDSHCTFPLQYRFVNIMILVNLL